MRRSDVLSDAQMSEGAGIYVIIKRESIWKSHNNRKSALLSGNISQRG
jgi:hypothetical protein